MFWCQRDIIYEHNVGFRLSTISSGCWSHAHVSDKIFQSCNVSNIQNAFTAQQFASISSLRGKSQYEQVSARGEESSRKFVKSGISLEQDNVGRRNGRR